MTLPPLVQAAPAGAESPAPRGERPPRRALPLRLRFLLRRLGRLALSLAAVLVLTFLLVRLVPGDAVRAALGPNATPEHVEQLRAELGLDKPVTAQFADYVTGLLRGDLGTSIRSERPVGAIIAQRLPATLTLAVLSFVVAVAGALPIGIAAAVSARGGRRRVGDAVGAGVLGSLIAIPNFLVGVGLIALLSVGLDVLPAAGWGEPREALLPVLALALGPMAYLARIVQVEMAVVLDSTYMVTARGKRLPPRLMYLRHALPNIVTASLTVAGLVLGGLAAGTVLIETVFAIPGLGEVAVSSVTGKDYPMIQGVVLVYTLIVLGVNLVVDLILITIDPRSSIAEG